MISTSMMPLGMVLFGPLADIVPIEYLLIGTGIVTLLLSIIMTRSRVLREVGWPVEKPAEEMSAS